MLAGSATRTIDDGNASVVQSPTTRLFWDKIVDKVIATVQSNYTWKGDGTLTGDDAIATSMVGKAAEGNAEVSIYTEPNVIARNPMDVTFFYTGSYTGTTDAQLKTALDEFARIKANNLIAFYGNRHKSKSYIYIMPQTEALNSSNATALSPIHWKPCDLCKFASKPSEEWFNEKINIDLLNNTAQIDVVSKLCWPYNKTSGIIPSN
jgi:hypothetical protein